MKFGDAQHKIRTHSANIRAVQQQIQLLRLGNFGVSQAERVMKLTAELSAKNQKGDEVLKNTVVEARV